MGRVLSPQMTHLHFGLPPQQQSWGGQREHLLGVAEELPLEGREPTLFYRWPYGLPRPSPPPFPPTPFSQW